MTDGHRIDVAAAWRRALAGELEDLRRMTPGDAAIDRKLAGLLGLRRALGVTVEKIARQPE